MLLSRMYYKTSAAYYKMKQSSPPKPKNIFSLQQPSQPQPQPEPQRQAPPHRILREQQPKLITHMLSQLIKLLHFSQSQGEYNSLLAQRIIYLYLKHQPCQDLDFDLPAEIDTLVDYLLNTTKLSDIQRCIDLLSLHELMDQGKAWRIRALVALREWYRAEGKGREARRANTVVVAQLTSLVAKKEVYMNPKLYLWSMTELIKARKILCDKFQRRKQHLETTEELSKLVSLIEAVPEEFRDKFQTDLMMTYFKLGEQHKLLHYESFSQKYYEMAYNIAMRTKDPFAKSIKPLLNK